ncbi:hypothetical protein AMTRI_Chr09g21100 [Amborella trichopoda]
MEAKWALWWTWGQMWTWRPSTVMGFKVLPLEQVAKNLQRLCDGVLLNRVGSQVTIFSPACKYDFF